MTTPSSPPLTISADGWIDTTPSTSSSSPAPPKEDRSVNSLSSRLGGFAVEDKPEIKIAGTSEASGSGTKGETNGNDAKEVTKEG